MSLKKQISHPAKMEAEVDTLDSLHNQKKDNNKFKTKKTKQNCQKTKLYGSPTTKELKKKHSTKPVEGAEMGSWAERTHGKAAAGGQVRWGG